jgi:hypothetical protein
MLSDRECMAFLYALLLFKEPLTKDRCPYRGIPTQKSPVILGPQAINVKPKVPLNDKSQTHIAWKITENNSQGHKWERIT